MSKKDTYEQLTEQYVMPILNDMQFELIDLEYVKEGSDFYLRIYIDKPGGITINDCEAVSRLMNEILDREDYIEDAYIFEVSSPGLGRPIKKDRDFERNINKDIEFKTYQAIDGCKEFAGTLISYNKDNIEVLIDDRNIVIDRKQIAQIKEALDF